MILFVGQVASDQRDRETFQELDYRQMFGPGTLGMAKWVGEVQTRIGCPSTWRAPSTPAAGPSRPVVIVAAEDLLTTPVPRPCCRASRGGPGPRPACATCARCWRHSALRDRRRRRLGRRAPARCSASPRTGSCRWVAAFASRTPSTTTTRSMRATSASPSIPEAGRARARSDLVIALGVRLGEMTTGGYTLLEAPRPQQSTVHLHAGAEELGPRLRRRPDAAGLCEQRRQGAGRSPPPPTRLARLERSAAADFAANRDASAGRASGHGAGDAHARAPRAREQRLHQRRRQLQRLVAPLLRYRGLQHHGRTQLGADLGAMGYGVPAAIAASLLYPDRTVINVAGDGDFRMTGQELATATGYGAGRGANRLISLVVDNGSYGTIRMHQEREFPGRCRAASCSTRTSLAGACLWLEREQGGTHGTVRAGLARSARRIGPDADPPEAGYQRQHHAHHAECDPRGGSRARLSAARAASAPRPPAPRRQRPFES